MSEAKEEKNQEEQKENQKNSFGREVWQWVQSIVISFILVFLLFTFVVRPLTVDGASMLPTFEDKDKIITTNLSKEYERGDVVVIHRKKEKPIIKRVIGVAGDEIDIDFYRGEVYLNGELLEEPYINERTHENHGVSFPVTVPEDCVFVMGDNRNHSDDSRNPKIGMIDEQQIFGKVIFRIYPFDKFGTVK